MRTPKLTTPGELLPAAAVPPAPDTTGDPALVGAGSADGDLPQADADGFEVAPPAAGLTATASPSLGDSGLLVRGPAEPATLTPEEGNLASARDLVTRLKEGSAPVISTTLGGESVSWAIRYRAGRDGSMTGGPTAHGLELSIKRPKFPDPEMSGDVDYYLVANDLDPLMRELIPLMKLLMDTRTREYGDCGVGSWCHVGFRFYNQVEVPNAHSYDGRAKVDITFSRFTGHAGEAVRDEHPVQIFLEVNAMSNDQPYLRKGQTYWGGGSDPVEMVADRDYFSESGYYFPVELGDEAIAQVLAKMRALGIVRWE